MNRFTIRVNAGSKQITPRFILIPTFLVIIGTTIAILLKKFFHLGQPIMVIVPLILIWAGYFTTLIFIKKSRGYQVYLVIYDYLNKNFPEAEIFFKFENNQLEVCFNHKLINSLIEISDKLQDKLSIVVQREYIGQKRVAAGVTYYFDELSTDYSRRRFGKYLLSEIRERDIIFAMNTFLQSFQLSSEFSDIHEKDDYIFFNHIIPKSNLESLSSELEFNKSELMEALQGKLWASASNKKIPLLNLVDMGIEGNKFFITIKEGSSNGNDSTFIPSPDYESFL